MQILTSGIVFEMIQRVDLSFSFTEERFSYRSAYRLISTKDSSAAATYCMNITCTDP